MKIGTNGILKRSIWHSFNGFDVLVHRGKSKLDMAEGTLLFDVHRGKSKLDMDEGTLLFDGQMLSLNVDSHQGPPQVARITAFQWQVIPPQFHRSTEVQQM